MGQRVIALQLLLLSGCAFAQGRPSVSPPPTQFEIGRHTFVDFGPPTDFYELILLRSASSGTDVEKIALTPTADSCIQSAKVEVANGLLSESVAELLGKTNPCTIPEKKLSRERKRCKNCLVFSGANVTMRVQCGSEARIIRADILDRDMFDPAANIPEHTSWTMNLLGRIDQVTGPGVLDRPMFPVLGEDKKDTGAQGSEILRDISAGRYDELFTDAPDKPSDLYRAAQIPPPTPLVRLLSVQPFEPRTFVQPGYPPIARLAHIEGTVKFTLEVASDGSTTNFKVENGHPMLRPATEEAVSRWKFSNNAAGQTIHAVVEFVTNCPTNKR